MSRKLFVGNLPYSVTSERLQEAFSQFGTVTSSKVIVDRETGRSRGFAFLEMETDDQGAAAMQAMNGALLDGRSIAVREAVERQPGGGGGGGFGGGGGGGGRDGGGFRPRGPRPPYGGGGGGGVMAAAAVAVAMAAAAVAVAIAAAAVAAAMAAAVVAAAAVVTAARLRARATAARCATGVPISPAAPPARGGFEPAGGDVGRAGRAGAMPPGPDKRRERDYEPRKRGFDDDQ